MVYAYEDDHWNPDYACAANGRRGAGEDSCRRDTGDHRRFIRVPAGMADIAPGK